MAGRGGPLSHARSGWVVLKTLQCINQAWPSYASLSKTILFAANLGWAKSHLSISRIVRFARRAKIAPALNANLHKKRLAALKLLDGLSDLFLRAPQEMKTAISPRNTAPWAR